MTLDWARNKAEGEIVLKQSTSLWVGDEGQPTLSATSLANLEGFCSIDQSHNGEPDWAIAPWNNPCEAGDRMCKITEDAPAPCPKSVTRFGSPEKASMFALIQSRANLWSCSP